MKHKLNKVVLLLTVFTTTSVFNSCNDDSKDVKIDNDDLYIVTTNNIVDTYFSPKKLNLYTQDKMIIGDWLANEYIGKEYLETNYGTRYLDPDDKLDINQVYAKHYYFLDDSAIKKYIDKKTNALGKEVIIDENDLLSPYKEYAKYFGDTLCISQHSAYGEYYGSIACVLPIVGIDVVCNKDFDNNHPFGTPLTDIMKYGWPQNLYGCLHEVDENNKLKYYGKKKFELYAAENSNSKPIQLNSIPEKQLIMEGNKYYLMFDHEPTAPGTYEFTVKFTFGPDPLTGETVDIAPAKVSIEF